jgi:predicted DNA-binding WGR domain protein
MSEPELPNVRGTEVSNLPLWPRSGSAFFHPVEKLIWVLSGSRVVRLRGDAVEIVAENRAVDTDEHASARQMHLFQIAFYFDTALATPCWLVSTRDRTSTTAGLAVARWTGERFERRTFENERQTESADRFAFDRRRGVLVHFVAKRPDSGGLTVRECGDDGRWRDVPGEWPALQLGNYVGWHGGRGEVVLRAIGQTHAWSGTGFTDLGMGPGVDVIGFSLAPGGKDPLVFVQESAVRVRCARLTPTGWKDVDVAPLEAMADAVYDEATGESLVLSPFTGPGRVQHAFAVFDAASRLVPKGRVMLHVTNGAPGGAGVAWGSVPWGVRPLHARADPERDAQPTIFRTSPDGGLTPLEAQPGASTLGIVAHGDALSSVRFDGTVDRFEGGRWAPTESATRPPKRGSAIVAAKADGTLLLVNGVPFPSGKLWGDAWIFDGRTWVQLKRKGKVPPLRSGFAAFHPGIGAWVVTGGTLHRGGAKNQDTWECSDKAWTHFAHDAASGEAWQPRLLDWDEPSRTLFAVTRQGGLFAYRGAGAWEALALLDRLCGASLTYDQRSRSLVNADASSFQRFALGEELDRAGRAAAPNEAAGTKGTSDASVKPGATGPVVAKPAAAKPTPKAAEPALPSEVRLRCNEDGADKFWFAKLADDGWTAEWGKWGAKGTRKTYPFATASAARADYEKKVRAKIAKGYEHVAGSAVAFVVEPAAGDEQGGDQVGGAPLGVDAATWPACRDCGHPMQHVLLVGRHEERLPLKEHAAMAVFACNGERSKGACRTWEADLGCNRVLLLASLDAPRLASPPQSADGKQPLAPIAQRHVRYRREIEDGEEPLPDTKVGGLPAWVQDEESVACDTCQAPMRYVAQIDERLDRSLNFGGGAAYVFLCPAEHQAKLLWQQ